MKHLSKAVILFSESQLGYPHHFWLAMGNLSEAEEEALVDYPTAAKEIRELRLEIEIDPKAAVKINDLLKRYEDEL